MTWELIFVVAVLVFAIASFALEKLPVDVTAITVLALLLGVSELSGSELLPSREQLIQVFANPAPLTIAAMFIVSHGLEKCGAIDLLAGALTKLSRLPYALFIMVLAVGVGGISAFVNNTPVVVIFLPVVISLAKKMDTPASKLLIPLSYVSIFGGLCTLIGTSTNLLLSGVITQYDQPPLGMFELSAIGLPLMVVGTLYLAFLGRRALPVRETLMSILSDEERREFITEAYVRAGSEVVGQSFQETSLQRRTKGIRLLEIIRSGVALTGELRKTKLQAGDRLVLSCRPATLAQARETQGIDFFGEREVDLEQIAAHEGAIVEGVIGPNSSIVGKTIREINFRQRFRMIVLAMHRRGHNVREQIESLPLEFGDTLLLMGSDRAIENLRASNDIILLDRPSVSARDDRRHLPLVLGVIGLLVLTVSLKILPIVAAAIIAVAILLLAGTIKPKDAYQAIDWRILLLIYGMLGLGKAMEVSGAAQLAAGQLANLIMLGPESWRPILALVCVYIFTNALTEMLSNNATVVLMAPIVLGLAATIGVDPRPLIIAACVASSASFATPIGYQTNTYVYSVGGYRFTDFFRVGIPLNALYFIVSVLLIPLIWRFA